MTVWASTRQPPQTRQGPSSAAGASSLEGFATAWCAVLILLSIVWPRYGFFALGGELKATPFTFMALLTWPVCALLCLFSSFSHRVLGALKNNLALSAVFVSWIGWRVFTAFVGEDPNLSIQIIGREILYLMPIWILVVGVATRRQALSVLFATVVMATALVELIACVQMTTGKSFAQLIGVQFAGNETFLLGVSEVKFRGGSARVQSTFSHPIVFGQYLAFAAPIVAWVAWRSRGAVRLIAVPTLLILPFVAWNTGSRAAVLGVAIAITLFVALATLRAARRPTYGSTLAMLAMCTLTLAAVGPLHGQAVNFIGGRTAAEASSSLYRSAMFDKGLTAIQKSPLTGFGEGRSAHHAGFYGKNKALTIDSAYLSYLLDSGWIGLLLVSGAWGLILTSLVSSALRLDAGSEATSLAAGAAATMIVFSILSIVDNVSLIYLASGVAMALRYQYCTRQPAAKDRGNP